MNLQRIKLNRALVILMVILFQHACQRIEPVIEIRVETGAIDDVGPTHCSIQGEIIEIGKQGILQHGFVWSDTPDPTLQSGSILPLGTKYEPGSFDAVIGELSASTTYYVKAYATTVGQIVYGAEISFTTGDPTVPQLHTINAFFIEHYSAAAGGVISSNGGAEVTSRGVCWSTDSHPDINDQITLDGTGTGTYESEMNDLEPYTLYFFRAYAINDIGIGYGEKLAFITTWDNSEVTDIEGNSYNTVQIGEQVWMAENLRTTSFPDGSPIQRIESATAWAELLSDDPALCLYENSDEAYNTYGALYTWPAAVYGTEDGWSEGVTVQGVCPDGWHLPDDLEWGTLELHLGMSELRVIEDGWRGWDEGGRLKQQGTDLWIDPNDMATNETGFTALPAGFRDADGSFQSAGRFTSFWSSNGYANDGAWLRGLHAWRGEILRDVYPRKDGFSVRCIKDNWLTY